jgi:hypothetical protein
MFNSLFTTLKKFRPDQQRDENGRFAEEAQSGDTGSSSTPHTSEMSLDGPYSTDNPAINTIASDLGVCHLLQDYQYSSPDALRDKTPERDRLIGYLQRMPLRQLPTLYRGAASEFPDFGVSSWTTSKEKAEYFERANGGEMFTLNRPVRAISMVDLSTAFNRINHKTDPYWFGGEQSEWIVLDPKHEPISKFRPDQTRDDAGRFASEGQTASVPTVAGNVRSPEFRQWFAGSKVVDKDGEPLTVYHGTDAVFSTFDAGKQRAGDFGKGFYFTDSKSSDGNFGEHVIAAHLSLQNPYIVRGDVVKPNGEIEWGKTPREEIAALYPEAATVPKGEINSVLQRRGHDGLIIGDYYIAFHPEQIKLTSNKHPTGDPDISKAWDEEKHPRQPAGSESGGEFLAEAVAADLKALSENWPQEIDPPSPKIGEGGYSVRFEHGGKEYSLTLDDYEDGKFVGEYEDDEGHRAREIYDLEDDAENPSIGAGNGWEENDDDTIPDDIWESVPSEAWELTKPTAEDRTKGYEVQTYDSDTGWGSEDPTRHLSLLDALKEYHGLDHDDKRLVYFTGRETRTRDDGDLRARSEFEVVTRPSFNGKLLREFPSMPDDVARSIINNPKRNKENEDPYLVAQAWARHNLTDYDSRLSDAREIEDGSATDSQRAEARRAIREKVDATINEWRKPKRDDISKVFDESGANLHLLSALEKAWDESAHPREPKGSDKGGEFVSEIPYGAFYRGISKHEFDSGEIKHSRVPVFVDPEVMKYEGITDSDADAWEASNKGQKVVNFAKDMETAKGYGEVLIWVNPSEVEATASGMYGVVPLSSLTDGVKGKTWGFVNGDGISKTAECGESDFRACPTEEIRKRDASKLSAGCVMAMLEPADAVDFLEFGSEIPEAELYTGNGESDSYGPDFGIEKSPHFTALYGLETQDVADIEAITDKFEPFYMGLGRVAMFSRPEKDHDVIYVPGFSSQLRRMNRRLKSLPYSNDYDGVYKIQGTIAYLKKGFGAKYVGDARFAGKLVRIENLEFSTPDHGKTVIPLGEVAKAFDPEQERDVLGRWTGNHGTEQLHATPSNNLKSILTSGLLAKHNGFRLDKLNGRGRVYLSSNPELVHLVGVVGSVMHDDGRYAVLKVTTGDENLHQDPKSRHGTFVEHDISPSVIQLVSEFQVPKEIVAEFKEEFARDRDLDDWGNAVGRLNMMFTLSGKEKREGDPVEKSSGVMYAVVVGGGVDAVKRFTGSVVKAFDPNQERDEHGRWTMGTGTPEFKTWFEGSVVKNPNGTPQVVYHGTKADFTSYDPGTDMFGGFFTSDDPAAASAYSQGKWSEKPGEPVEGSNVMPVYLNLKNPFNLNQPVTESVIKQFVTALKADRIRLFEGKPEKIEAWKDYMKRILPGDMKAALRRENIWGAMTQLGIRGNTRTRILAEMGHDGTVFHGKDGIMNFTGNYTQYSVFRPDQIKSVWNRGSWDAKDPHISKTFDPDEPRNEHGEWTKDANHVDKPAGISDTGGMETKSELKYPGAKTRSQDPDDYHFISTGAKENFYTLRHRFTEATYANSEQGTVSTGAQERDYHLQNLSTDRDAAIKQAEALTGLKLSAEFDVLPIGEKRPVDWSVFQSGKYVGSSIHEVREKDPDYLLWIAENQSPKSKTYGGTVELIQALMAHELKGRSDQRESEKSKAESERDTRVEAFKPVALKLIGATEWPDPTWQQDLRDPIPGRKDWEIESGQANVKLLYHENTKTWEARDGGFTWNIAAGLMNGKAPTGRGATITADIVAKMEGKRNSKGYEQKYNEVMDVLEKGAK